MVRLTMVVLGARRKHDFRPLNSFLVKVCLIYLSMSTQILVDVKHDLVRTYSFQDVYVELLFCDCCIPNECSYWMSCEVGCLLPIWLSMNTPF